jgi:ABC-type transport system involved in multi-copper enzyme maturation permease subunit
MGASFAAELLKLRKRPATWVLALVWVAVVVLFGYLLTYSFVATPPEPAEDVPPEVQTQERAINEAQLEALLPENLMENLFGSGIFGVGAAVVLILGALTAGSEYSWGTLKTVLSQRPGKLAVLSGKLLALGVFLVVFVALGLAAGAASSLVVARLEEAAVAWPTLGEALRGVGIGSLVFAVWGTFGFGLAVLFRGTPLAIGLGLAWALAVENTIAALPIRSDAYESFRRFTLGENTSGATSYFGSPFPEEFGLPEPLVDPERAAITLAAYTAAFVVLAALFFWRRDVT